MSDSDPILEVQQVETGYGFLKVLRGVSIKVMEGEFVSLVGPNGAGKSTLLRAISGYLPVWEGKVLSKGKVISGLPPYKISRLGFGFVSEELNLFTRMTVLENLLMGAFAVNDQDRIMDTLVFVFTLFPRLRERKGQLAGTLSGGERKMLAIARGLMSNPSLLLVDEPSLGLAPQLTLGVFEALKTLQKSGATILLVEQNVKTSLQLTDRAYVLEHGQIILEGRSQDLKEDIHVRKAYLGI